MSHHDIRSAKRPDPDQSMVDIANYVTDYRIDSPEAFTTARYMLLDSLGCSMLAMKHPECTKHLGPIVPGANMVGGARVPGTSFELDPVQAAYNIGVQVRWLDFNECPTAAAPSDAHGGRASRHSFGQPALLRRSAPSANKCRDRYGQRKTPESPCLRGDSGVHRTAGSSSNF